MKKKKGISLIVLIITIIVMLILAAATMITLIGDNGIITKAQEAAFREEMLSIKEIVNLYNIVSQVDGETEISLVPLSISDIESDNLKDTLKLEIAYLGNYELEINKLTEAYVSSEDNFKTIVTKRSESVKDLYYIQGEENINRKYIYNKATDVIYKVSPTRIGIHKVHSIEELEFKKSGGTRDKLVSKNYTKISYNTEVRELGGISYYEPNLNNIAKEPTSLVFYKLDGNTVTETTKEISAADWLAKGRINTITENNQTYVLYDYSKQIWANMKIVSNGLEAWWVWIPRYAYNEGSATESNTQIIFVDINNKPLDTEKYGTELPEGYAVAGSFKNNNKQGVWSSKYEPSTQMKKDTSYYEYYIPDLSGFNKENVYIQIYNKNTNSFEKEVKASTITNLSQFATKNLWFDYENRIWANIKVKANDLEAWWVWIPRYAYNESGTTDETDIIFVDVNNNPIDGSKLPNGYKVAGSFKNNNKKGIWASKYEPTPTIVVQKQNITAASIDVSNFNKQTSHMVFYKIKDGKVLDETKTMTIEEWESKGRPTEITSLFTKYKLFDYENNVWANIKVKANDLEAWWVWIPRYAYNELGTTDQTDIIFVDENDNPIDGSKLPNGYKVAGSFKNNNKKGIWASKYEPIQTVE